MNYELDTPRVLNTAKNIEVHNIPLSFIPAFATKSNYNSQLCKITTGSWGVITAAAYKKQIFTTVFLNTQGLFPQNASVSSAGFALIP